MISSKYERVYSRYENVDNRNEQHCRNIEDVNLLYLQGLRDLARENPSEAAALYGVSEKASAEIANASIADLQALAKCGVAVFRVQCKSASVVADADPNGRMSMLARIIK